MHRRAPLVADRKPVQSVHHARDIITSSGAGDEACGGFQDWLWLLNEALKHTQYPQDATHNYFIQRMLYKDLYWLTVDNSLL